LSDWLGLRYLPATVLGAFDVEAILDWIKASRYSRSPYRTIEETTDQILTLPLDDGVVSV
jgi:hypothetical protein